VWKWLWITLLMLGLGLMPVGVSAATTQNVEVTATPAYGIISFSIDYISDTQMDLSWTVTGDVVNVMVRAQYGEDLDEIPNEDTAPSDGVQVYYGPGSSFSDTSMDFDQNPGPLYYKIWGQKADDKWYTGSYSAWEESAVLLLIALIILALGFTIVSFLFKKGFLAFAGAAVWMITGIYCFSRALETWDTYFSLGFLFLFLTIVFSFSPLSWRETTHPEETPEDPAAKEMREEQEGFDRERNQYGFLYRNRQPKRKLPRLPR